MGNGIEAALEETEKYGPEDKQEVRQKYTLAQLLDPDFRLPIKTAVAQGPIESDVKGVQGIMFDEV